MKALVSWLRDLVEIPDGVSIDALAHALHMSGFELAGIERVAILRYQVEDIRLFYENDLRFLEQFPY